MVEQKNYTFYKGSS